jgi:hypothetical protein
MNMKQNTQRVFNVHYGCWGSNYKALVNAHRNGIPFLSYRMLKLIIMFMLSHRLYPTVNTF